MPAPPEEEGAPGWVTTFADLMSLLMCFFVMLLSMAQIDVEKFKAFAEGMAKAVGSAPNVALKELSVDDIMSQAESIKTKLRLRTLGDAKKIKNLLINGLSWYQAQIYYTCKGSMLRSVINNLIYSL